MLNVSLIACVSQDRGLGHQGQLLWHIPADMAFFKRTTMGGAVVMGRKTFESIGKPLPGRRNIVLSRHPVSMPGIITCSSQQELLSQLEQLPEPIFIIGGATLYKMFVGSANRLLLTEVAGCKPADAYFPDFDKSLYARHVLSEGEYDGTHYSIVEYTRKS